MTLELATEVGYAGLSMEAVARRAKHHLPRWPSRAALMLDALSRVWTTDLDYRDTGDVRADLREHSPRSAPALTDPPIGPVYRGLIAEAQPSTNGSCSPWRSAPSPGSPARSRQANWSPTYYRHLLSTRLIDEKTVDDLLDMFMAAYSVNRA